MFKMGIIIYRPLKMVYPTLTSKALRLNFEFFNISFCHLFCSKILLKKYSVYRK